MGPGSARIAAGGGDLGDGAFAVPGAGSPGQAKRFVLAAAGGVALAVGAVTGTPAAHATAVVSARPAAAVHAHPRLEPCPCADPLCREVCSQSTAAGIPASLIHRHAHLAAAQAMVRVVAISVNCPPPSTAAAASSDGQPGC
jgi:hypothetical protein